MIDPAEFERGLVLLGSTYRVSIDPPLVRLYYGALSPHLSTEQFGAAVQRTVTRERFWPSPGVVLQHAGCSLGSPAAFERLAELRGGEAFERLLALREYTVYGHRLTYGVVERELGIAAVRALRAIGGPRRVADLTEHDATWVRRDFARACAAAESDATSTPTLGTGRPGSATESLVAHVAAALDMGTRPRALPLPPDAP